jgi:uncharacterized protein
MDALTAISAVLAAMLATIYLKRGLEVTVGLGVVLTSILFGVVDRLPSFLIETLSDYQTLTLMLMFYLVFFLNSFLTGAGAMKRVVETLEEVVAERRIIIASVPMLIGLMPTPSGAVLSAPFADEIGRKAGVDKEGRLLVNYWFRHVSEYVNPVYPGVILATGIVGVSFYSFFLSNAPVMLIYLAVGAAFFILPISRQPQRARRIRHTHLMPIVQGLAPIVLAVLLPVALNFELHVSLACAIILALALNSKAAGNLRKVAAESMKVDLLAVVFLVMLFKRVLEGSSAASQISSSLTALGVPHLLMLILIPMLMGFLTGLTMGYVGLSFPILLPLLQPAGVTSMAATTTAFVSGYLGVLLSPMHLCFSVTQRYFNADVKETYRRLLPPLALVLAATLAYFWSV